MWYNQNQNSLTGKVFPRKTQRSPAVRAVEQYRFIRKTNPVTGFPTFQEDGKMTIDRKLNGSTLEIAVTGKLDTLTAPELAEELKKGLDG